MEKEQVIVFDLENILLFYNYNEEAENQFIFDFLKERGYLFHFDDLDGKTPYLFMQSIGQWKNNDDVRLEAEIRKLRREALLSSVGADSVSGVLQALYEKYHIIVLSRSQGDGIVGALAKIGIRSYVDLIVPAEEQPFRLPIKSDNGQNRLTPTAHVCLDTHRIRSSTSFTRSKPSLKAYHAVKKLRFLDSMKPKPNTLGLGLSLELALSRYPEIPLEQWHYVCLPESLPWGYEAKINCIVYGKEPFGDLEDIMEEFL